MPATFRCLATVCALLLAPAATLAAGQLGERAPDFSLQDTTGQTVDVAFGQGEVFLVSFVGYG